MDFSGIRGFEWDEANLFKNAVKHNVFDHEAEQLFFNHPLVIGRDHKHSAREERFYALGKSNHGRLLFAAFTIRLDKIRVISVRDMTKREARIYEEEEKRDPRFSK